MARHHLALLAVALAVGVASAASPAHAKKNKASCPPNSCNLVTDAELQVVSEALDKIVAAQRTTYARLKGTTVVDTATPGAPCSVADEFGGETPIGWGAGCQADSPNNSLPDTMEMSVQCPPEFFDLEQFTCRAYVADAEGAPIKALPVVWSGSVSRYLTCSASLDGLPDGTIVSIVARVVCSGYLPPPTTGANTASAVDAAVAETVNKLRAQGEELAASPLAAEMARRGGN
jgi:hypothetical protein